MISKQDCHILNSCHRDYIGHGVSPYDASSGVLVGRPYGGVGFMWKNSLDECVTIVNCDYDWMCCIKLSSANKDMYIINVIYLTNVRIITTCTWIICLKLLCSRRVLTVRVFLLWAILMLIYPKDHPLEAFYVTSAMTIRSL